MLKGKKKALAAQVLLGLMVAGNAYTVDCGIASAEDYYVQGVKGTVQTPNPDDNKFQLGNYGDYRFDNDGFGAILSSDGKVFTGLEDPIQNNNILISTNLVGCFGHNAALIKGDIVKGNTITIGHDYYRSINDYWSPEDEYQHVLRNIFNDLNAKTSENNKLVLGTIVKNGELAGIDVGSGNDIQLAGGTQGGKTADYSYISFAGRDLTLDDAAGTEKIKSANMKGDINAARHLTATGNIVA